MKERILPALIIAVGLIIGGFLAGGRYAVVQLDANDVGRLDRFTGVVTMCIPGAPGKTCGFTLDTKPAGPSNSN